MHPLIWPSTCSALVIAAIMSISTTARSEDPHKLYESRCGGCHSPHAREFVRDHLVLQSGEVFGRRSAQQIGAFLETGHGWLKPDEISILVSHLTDISRSGGLFRKKCIICHDRAVVFARTRLAMRNGVLVGRYSGRNIRRFLNGHGRLSPSEVSNMIEVLERQLITAEPADN